MRVFFGIFFFVALGAEARLDDRELRALLPAFDRARTASKMGPVCEVTPQPASSPQPQANRAPAVDLDEFYFMDRLPETEGTEGLVREDWRWLVDLTALDPLKPASEIELELWSIQPNSMKPLRMQLKIGKCVLTLRGEYRLDLESNFAELKSVESVGLYRRISDEECPDCPILGTAVQAQRVRPLAEIKAAPPATRTTLRPDFLAPLRGLKASIRDACK